MFLDFLAFSKTDTAIACGLLFMAYILWFTSRQLSAVRRWVEIQDVPLREVIVVTITLKREFFLESLKLSAEEIDGSPELVGPPVVGPPVYGPTGVLVSGGKPGTGDVQAQADCMHAIRVRLLIWKSHYSGNIAFYFEDKGSTSKEFLEIPTTSDQFPVALGSAPLLRNDPEGDAEHFGRKTEMIEVLLSHKSFIVRGKYGRLGQRLPGHCFKPDASDLLIPILESDLAPYINNSLRAAAKA